MRHPPNTKILRQNLPSSSQPTSIIPISSSKSDFKQFHQPVCGRQWPDFLNHNLQISKYHYKVSCAPALPKSLPPTMSAIPNTILRVSSSAVQAAARSTSKPFTRVGVVVSAGKMPKMIKVRVPSPVWNSKLRKYFHHTKDHLTHDENSACEAGDIVRIQPFVKHSKHKKHVVYEIISPFGTSERKPIETPEERDARIQADKDKKLEKKATRRANKEAKWGARADRKQHRLDKEAENAAKTEL
ncbi:hypothetical protein TWF225_008330 [Orbilia oligospora]|uniref:37S ribosomal protein S17, mitochondrial n=1 Tax=Orbilia oligospora TaxID=2813651 RepID=A0A8H2HSH3_ORBOL|nr:hypothetical protein TWF225_008330 [Orbilia oligospora]KAF3254775.1 hypothetical protein TWF128_006088 [Orbilia oligospora]KAF3269067.1 hypothetical protein TWF217_010337 [Orbilia oligospora]KAF3290556.1 hypothetical protein TWF132_006878 [Orbilia oligospora]TGJ67592.1 hypothetical protein EYR41_006711 [Orbilia oligospora]